MGFRYLAQQTTSEAIFQHNAGAFLLFAGAWLCWQAIVVSRDAWWRNPVYAARFAQKFRSEKGSWVALVQNHPATISQMIGYDKDASGAVAKSICLPACMLCLAGGFMVNQSWPLEENEDPVFACFVNTLRTSLMPVGFLMVLFTPVVSLDKHEYGDSKTGQPLKGSYHRSELEEQWHGQHHNIHGAGFIAAVVLGILWEACFCIADVVWFCSLPLGSMPGWHTGLRTIWCVLALLRSLAVLFQAVCLVNFLRTTAVQLNDPRLQDYWRWMTEYGSLVLGGLVFMYNGASILTFVGHTPRSWLGTVVTMGLLLETLRCTLGFFGSWARWSGLIALFNFNKVDFEGLIRYIFTVRLSPPLMTAMKTKCKAELLGIDMAQAGDRDPFNVAYHNLGKGLPKVEALVVSPGLVETVTAITHDELSDEDLGMYHEDLARVLRQLPSADIMILPFGRDVFKMSRRMPLMVLPLGNYSDDLKKVSEGVPGIQPWLPASCASLADLIATFGLRRQGLMINSIPFWPWRSKVFEGLGWEEVARDITDGVHRRVPAGKFNSLKLDFVAQLENGVDLRPLYKVLNHELAGLGEYEVQFRGLVGGPPQLVAVTLKGNLEKAKTCPLWCEGLEVSMATPASTDGKLYHKLP